DPEFHLLLERIPLRGGLHHPAEDPHVAVGHPVPRLRSVPGCRHAGHGAHDRHAAGPGPLPVPVGVVRQRHDGGGGQGLTISMLVTRWSRIWYTWWTIWSDMMRPARSRTIW